MDRQEEYHDPDYPSTSAYVKENSEAITEEEKVEKIKTIIRREFSNELEIREAEVLQIDQRMLSSRRLLNLLRYTLVSNYFRDQKLQLANSQVQDEVAAQHEPRARAEVSSMLRESQRRIHPSVRKLLGKQAVDLDEILFRSRVPRAKARKDYSAMVQARNYTIAADTTKSLRPGKPADPEESGSSRPKKVPRHLQPKIVSVVTLDEATRNQMKHRYRIIIGNTSKYAPAASRVDRSTHKWLLYVRGAPHAPDLSRLLTALRVRLHHSYAPHHTVHLHKPPFHISRRGWGEFPAKIELHFALPERNRPATVEHTIKLDRNYTGLQILGAETVVDVWLYSTPEMLPYEYKDNTETDQLTHLEIDMPPPLKENDIKQEVITEPIEYENDVEKENDSWLDFFSKDTTELDVDEMIIKPAKKTEEGNLETLVDDLPKIKTEIEIPQNDDTEMTIEDHNDESKYNDYCVTEESWHARKNNQEELPNELLAQPTSPKKRIMKYMDPTTGKIYYLEMDRNLDLSKVQEIVINSKGNIKTAKISPIKSNGLKNVRRNTKKGVSLLKPEVKTLLKTENNIKTEKAKSIKTTYTHIENDHCYLGSSWSKTVCVNDVNISSMNSAVSTIVIKKEKELYNSLCAVLNRFNSVKVAVNYLLKKIPVISDWARDPDYVKCFPFVVETEERYWRMDFAKRRNIEWSRAKLINKMLTEHFPCEYETVWRTKQILIYSRLHGFYPIRSETVHKPTENQTEWSSWVDLDNTRNFESNIKDYYPTASDISSLTEFNAEEYQNCLSESLDLTDSDEEIDIVNEGSVKVKQEVVIDDREGLTVLPVEDDEDRLRFMFLERKCADIGIELRNEDVGSGYSYSAVHAVMLSAVRSFAEELVRSSLAVRLAEGSGDSTPPVWSGSSSRTCVWLPHVSAAAARAHRLPLSGRALGAPVRRQDMPL